MRYQSRNHLLVNIMRKRILWSFIDHFCRWSSVSGCECILNATSPQSLGHYGGLFNYVFMYSDVNWLVAAGFGRNSSGQPLLGVFYLRLNTNPPTSPSLATVSLSEDISKEFILLVLTLTFITTALSSPVCDTVLPLSKVQYLQTALACHVNVCLNVFRDTSFLSHTPNL